MPGLKKRRLQGYVSPNPFKKTMRWPSLKEEAIQKLSKALLNLLKHYL
jgi:hypothetical protein